MLSEEDKELIGKVIMDNVCQGFGSIDYINLDGTMSDLRRHGYEIVKRSDDNAED